MPDLLGEAVSLHQAGQLTRAAQIYDAILKVDPRNGDALNLRGVAALDTGHAAEAVALLERASASVPNFPPVHFNRGNALAALNRADEALVAYTRAIELKPDYADARLNAGLLLERTGRLEDAIGAFRSMAQACPQDARGHHNLGVCLEKLLARKNVKTKVIVPEAFSAFRRALELAPLDGNIHCAVGTLCSRIGDYRQALIHTQRAVELKPTWADAWVNLGGHKEALGDRSGAIAAFDRALALDPRSAGAAVNRGLALLSLGRLAEGWSGYSRRFEDSRFPFVRRDWPWRQWNGESLVGKTIFLWSDQGIGDEILYSSMIAEVATQASRCVVECSLRLASLYRRSFPGVEIIVRRAASEPALRARGFDYQCSILDVGQWLRPSIAAFPNRGAILVPDPARSRSIRDRYSAMAQGRLLVGLSWRSINPTFGAAKSATLEDLLPLLRSKSLMFVNAQYGDTAEEIRTFEESHGISIFRDPDIDALADLEGLSAQLAALDLLVSVSNTTSHLAAAVGVPTWLHVPDGHKRLWYWLDMGIYSPWYRSVVISRSALRPSMAALAAGLDQATARQVKE